MDKLTIRRLCDNIQYKLGTGFDVSLLGPSYGLRHWQIVPDVRCPAVESKQYGRKWYISRHSTESEVLQTALLAVLQFEEHEARQNFHYKGRKLFGPHIDISQKDVRA